MEESMWYKYDLCPECTGEPIQPNPDKLFRCSMCMECDRLYFIDDEGVLINIMWPGYKKPLK